MIPPQSSGARARRLYPLSMNQLTWALVCHSILLASAGAAQAAISIGGVADRQVYSDHVALIVNSESGFDYTVELDGDPIPTDTTVDVVQADYHELYVYRRDQSSGAEEEQLVRFIVRASERGTTELGLPPWTPYPQIPSAQDESAGAVLEIVAPETYPMGLPIPIVARVEDATGQRLGLNGAVSAAEFPSFPIELRRGVGYTFLPAAAQAGVVSYSAAIHLLQAPTQTTIEAATSWQIVSQDITSSTDWGEDARIYITGAPGNALTVGAGATLTIGAGSVIKLAPGTEVTVLGSLVVNGTAARPVVFTPEDPTTPWGGLLFTSAASSGTLTGAILTGSGADANWFNNHPGYGTTHRDEQCLFLLTNGASVDLTDCYLVKNEGQAGHAEASGFSLTGCLVQDCVTTGQYNGGSVTLRDCALIGFPYDGAPFADGDNDALYLTGGAHSLTDCLVGWALDDCVDAGSGAQGTVTVTGCWFESCFHEGLAWSEPRTIDTTGSVALNCGQGIECGWGAPDVAATGCFSTANLVGARFGDCYDWTYTGFLQVSDSLLLYNYRDVWGRAWDNWTEHLAQMDIQNNYLSAADANHPNNVVWDPDGVPAHAQELVPFMPTPAGLVGMGLATVETELDFTQVTGEVPVRLSTFTTSAVQVDYSVDVDSVPYATGSLRFVPGETLKFIEFPAPPLSGVQELRVTLSNPVNAQLTGNGTVVYRAPSQFTVPLVVEGDEWRYFKGTAQPPADWAARSFDDTTWTNGATPIGYENGSGYELCLATELNDMANNYISVFARRHFWVDDPSVFVDLTLNVDFDDGYIAYLNGVEVASEYAPNPPTYDSPSAAPDHEACCGTSGSTGPCPPVETDIGAHLGELVAGDNVLAIQVHNRTLSSSDLLLIPELHALQSAGQCGVDADCSDGIFCNGIELCVAGSCQAGADPCDDGLSCTDDLCEESTSTCSYVIQPGWCRIGGVCYQDGDVNPVNECEECRPTLPVETPLTVTLLPDTGATGSPRWLDVADQAYGASYQAGYDYAQATVQIDTDTDAETLHGTLTASGLKPNFAYQLKLSGVPETESNERIGLTGRWIEEEWNGTAWVNSHNLNNKGDGSSPNPNDLVYYARRDIPDDIGGSPTGKKYRYSGYLVFDYFITDESGSATLNFSQDSSYHVLFKTTQRTRTSNDGPIKTVTFTGGNPDPVSAYDSVYPEATEEVFGEWERLPAGGMQLPSGYYEGLFKLTEESFHGSGLAGNWYTGISVPVTFDLVSASQTGWSPSPSQTPCGDPATADCDNPDICNGNGTCLNNHEPDGTACEDGLFCTGADTCQNGACTGLGDPCDPLLCNETTDTCDVCVSDTDCDDGVACTDDTCVGDVCVFTANDANCPDDGAFCNGTEYCDAAMDCVHTGDPCPPLTCNEATDACEGEFPTLVTFQQGVDGYAGTADTFIAQQLPTTNYGNSSYFEWDESWGTSGDESIALLSFADVFGPDYGKVPVGAQIVSAVLTLVVSDVGDNGSLRESLVDWDESVTYNTLGGDAGAQPDEYGAEVAIVPGGALTAYDVDVTASIQAWANNPADNRGWIILHTGTNGVNVQSSEASTVAEHPKLTVEYAVECRLDMDCDDSNACTSDACVASVCVNTPVTDGTSCSDGLFCNGEEACVGGACQPGSDPCPQQACDEIGDACVGGECAIDEDCDDAVFCNGMEICDAGTCVAGPEPCTDSCEQCDEGAGACNWCIIDVDGNGWIAPGDFSFFAGCYSGCYTPGQLCEIANFDGSPDGCVGPGDFAGFAGCYGFSCAGCVNCFPAPSRSAPRGTGSLESLGAAADVELVAVRVPTPGSTADVLPRATNKLAVGDTFYLEAWVRGIGLEKGMAAVYVDVEYDASRLTVANVEGGDRLGLFGRGEVDAHRGRVHALGGCAQLGDTSVGLDSPWVRVGTLMLVATGRGQVVASTDRSAAPYGLAIVDTLGLLEPRHIRFGTTTLNLVGQDGEFDERVPGRRGVHTAR